MKPLYTLGFFFLVMFGNAQIVNIPDANLKARLLVATPQVYIAFDSNQIPIAVDTNGDGEIQVSEALTVYGFQTASNSIVSLQGLEAFTNLEYLNLDFQQLTTLAPIEGLTNLESLSVEHNQIAAINFDQLVNLGAFSGSYNPFTTLDLSHTKVTYFDLDYCPNLTYLNIKNGYISECNVAQDVDCQNYWWSNNLSMVCLDANEMEYFLPDYSLPGSNPNAFYTSYCTFTPGGPYNTISGAVVNCDDTSIAVPARMNVIGATDTGSVYSDASGDYQFYTAGVSSGTIVPYIANSYYVFSPASAPFSFAGGGNTQIANFCLSPTGVHPDLEITIIPTSVARPGFDAFYTIRYENKGTETQSGIVSFTYLDNIIDFITASVVPTQSTGSLQWSFTDLAPFESREIEVTLNINSPMESPAVNIGDQLDFSANVAAGNDETPIDNTFGFKQVVVGSFDPNDKAVSRATIGLAELGEYLYYTVRFQNTGTFPAENVVVKDILSDNVNLSTLDVVSASHSYRSTLTLTNQLEFFFEGINLPAASDNEPASHGYVTFRVKPKNTLVVGNTIQNSARIFFDFNFPITTNTVTTTVTALGITDLATASFVLHPNPAQQSFQIESDAQIDSVAIYNTLGQLVKIVSGQTTIDVSDLKSGTYLVRIKTSHGIAIKKVTKL